MHILLLLPHWMACRAGMNWHVFSAIIPPIRRTPLPHSFQVSVVFLKHCMFSETVLALLSATSPLVISPSYWKCFIVIFHSKHWTYQRFFLIMLTYVNRQYLFISPCLSPKFPQWISINIALNRTLSAGRHACTAQVSVQMQRRHHRAAALARRRRWTWR